LVDPFISEAKQFSNSLKEQANSAFGRFEETYTSAIITTATEILTILALTSLIGWLTYRSIALPLGIISQTISDVKSDNANARTGLVASRDELTQLGSTLDDMLDEKNETHARMEAENDQINESVIELLEGTSTLSDRDLTVRLQVREDITGPVADAMNMATKEIGQALGKIRQISELVKASSSLITEQSTQVTRVSETEKELVDQTIQKLEAVSTQMRQVAKWSQACNQVAKKATTSTDSAVESVTNTVSSMGEIRDTISETEKRIKRLSERSQEISSIVDIINSISERTHVLALNASMQAAAAGDAGRGFAVVADEVQRLAESSRDSTSQISVLVRNIQSETAAAVDTMNTTISEVVEGSKLAKLAGDQMQETQSTTKDLARAVGKIYEQSTLQARETDLLREQSGAIQDSTVQTRQELKRQAQQTHRLSMAANALTSTVSVFALPEEMLTQSIQEDLIDTDELESAPVVTLGTAAKPHESAPVLQTSIDNVKAIG